MFGAQTLLGLAIDESGADVVEVRIQSGRPEVQRFGHWNLPEKLDLNNPGELGRKLRQFLRTNNFSSKQAVIGIPTKWVVAKEITAPPASSDTLTGMLAIAAERAFSLNAGELVFDYCGRTHSTQKREVLLVAARRQMINRINEMAVAAGLQVQSLTVSALAFGKILSEAGSESRYGLYMRPTYCEFWAQTNGSPRFIQHVPMSPGNETEDRYIELLASTIQRLTMLSSQDDLPPCHVKVYDGYGFSNNIIDRLNERLGSRIIITAAQDSSDHPEQAQSAAALAVAMTAARKDDPPVNFLNPRIGARKRTGRKRIALWAGMVGAACLLALVAVLMDMQADRTDIATYTEQLELMSEDIAATREVVDRISYAGSWTSQKPVFLDCLRELTLTFPEEPVIWATNLRLSENTGALVGKAVDEESFYQVLDKMKEHKAFSNVQMIHIRDAGRDSREKEFAINFEFQGGP